MLIRRNDSTMFITFVFIPILKLQLEEEILDFSEGLRVVGVKPEDKIALFADNSCRWLVADQGTVPFLAYQMCY